MKTLGLKVKMDQIPDMELTDTSMMNELEKKLLKSLPLFMIYRELSVFCAKNSMIPKNYLTGEVFDYIHFTEEDWNIHKWPYILYAKLKQDIYKECKHSAFTPNYF